jgi:hypothetical protein
MSRSRRKTPICAIATNGFDHSEKKFKKMTNRKLRHKEKMCVKAEREILPIKHELVNQYSGPKDGKQYLGIRAVVTHPDCMRK